MNDTTTPALPPPLDREQGIIAFNRRVLALAESPNAPLLERLRAEARRGGEAWSRRGSWGWAPDH